MQPALRGLVLDSSTVIRAERNKQSIPDFIDAILQAHGSLDLSLSPVTLAELVLLTTQTAGQIEGQEC